MYCPKCGSQTGSDAMFCARCGSRIIPGAMPEGGAVAAGSSAGPKPWMWALVALLLALVGIVLYLLLRPQPEVLAAAPAPRPKSVLQTTKPAPPEMPNDVYDWLCHLEDIEKRKESLAADQKAKATVFMTQLTGLGALSGALGDDGSLDVEEMQNPSSVAEKKIENLKPPWNRLADDFESLPPPEECRAIFDAYSDALREIAGQMGDLTQTLNDLGSNPEAALSRLYQDQGAGSTRIDDDLDETDRLVATLCGKYQTDKWFKVRSDRGAGALLGVPGMGSMGMGSP